MASTTSISANSVLCYAEKGREFIMGITLGDFKSDMTLTWEDDDGVEQGVTAPIDMWVTYILLALSEDQQRNVMDHVIDQIEAENLRRQVLEDEVTASEFDAEYE